MFSVNTAYVQNMENNIETKTKAEPAIIGTWNEQNAIVWKFSDRLLNFISCLPEKRQYPLIAHLEHELGHDLSLLVIHHDDLKKSDWHTMEDYQ